MKQNVHFTRKSVLEGKIKNTVKEIFFNTDCNAVLQSKTFLCKLTITKFPDFDRCELCMLFALLIEHGIIFWIYLIF